MVFGRICAKFYSLFYFPLICLYWWENFPFKLRNQVPLPLYNRQHLRFRNLRSNKSQLAKQVSIQSKKIIFRKFISVNVHIWISTFSRVYRASIFLSLYDLLITLKLIWDLIGFNLCLSNESRQMNPLYFSGFKSCPKSKLKSVGYLLISIEKV